MMAGSFNSASFEWRNRVTKGLCYNYTLRVISGIGFLHSQLRKITGKFRMAG